MSLLEAVARARANRDFDRVARAIPYLSFLGVSVRHQDEGLLFTLAYRERNIGNPVLPALHGGVVGAFLESAATLELLWAVELTALPKVVNLQIDYLRPGGPRDTHARAEVTRQGARVATVWASAWQRSPDRPIATAHGHFLLSPKG